MFWLYNYIIMKAPLSETEQDNLRTRGILGKNEIAYRENNVIFAEDVFSSIKRIINTSSNLKENKNILFG